MTPCYFRDCRKLLELTVIMMGIFSTSSLKQCGPKTIVTFTNVGIKLCELKCAEHGQCLSFQFDMEALTCRLSRGDLNNTKKKNHTRLSKDSSDVSNGSCTSMTCSIGQRCLKTRSGKPVCVQDGKQTYIERSPQRDDTKQETLVDNPLYDACEKGNLILVKHILSRGLVDINIRDKKYRRTPLMMAAKKGHSQIVELLLRKGANVSHVDNNGYNTLHWACSGGNVDIVLNVLLQHSVDINSRGGLATTPLMTTVYRGHREVFDVLVGLGANVSLVDDNGDSILYSACRGGHVGMVRYILSNYSVDVNSRNKLGKTPLMTTVFRGHSEVFDYLVGMGANVLRVDDDGDNILNWACRGGHVGMVKHLLSNYSIDITCRGMYGRTPMLTAVYFGHIDVFKYLVSLGANVSDVDDHGDNILHGASVGGHAKMVQYIISQDIVDINSRGRYGRTPLMKAAYFGEKEAFDVLVRSGCRTDLVDDSGHTILHLATLGGRVEMVKYILSQNMVDINASNKRGHTASMIAKRKGQRACYDCLVSRDC